MKKILFLSVLLTTSYFSFADYVRIKKENGGCSGYSKIDETHNDDGHSLKCQDPGNEACKWVYPPVVTTNGLTVKHVMDVIEANITNNDFKGGTLFIQDLNIYVEVTNVSISIDGVISYDAAFEN